MRKILYEIAMVAGALSSIAVFCAFFVLIVMLIGRVELLPLEKRVKVLEDKVRLLQQK